MLLASSINRFRGQIRAEEVGEERMRKRKKKIEMETAKKRTPAK
jgi:hypothetical protein